MKWLGGAADKCLRIDDAAQFADAGADLAGGVLDEIGMAELHRLQAHPERAWRMRQRNSRRVLRSDEHVAAGEIDLIGDGDGHRLRRSGTIDFIVADADGGDFRGSAGRKNDNGIAGAQFTGSDLAGVTADAVSGSKHVLNRKTQRLRNARAKRPGRFRDIRATADPRTTACDSTAQRCYRHRGSRQGRRRDRRQRASKQTRGSRFRFCGKTSSRKSTRSILLMATAKLRTPSSEAMEA